MKKQKTKEQSRQLALTNGTSPAPRDKSNVPSRARTRIGRWHAAFLDALTKTISVTAAARAAGVNRSTAYAHRNENPAFAEAWDNALNEAIDRLEFYVYDRAKKDDSQLAMFLLKAHRPAIYRERIEAAVAGGIVLIPAKRDGPE